MPAAKITSQMLSAILRVTRIENELMHRALHDHLVLEHSCVAAAERYGYRRQQLAVHAKHIAQKLLPAFDAYSVATTHKEMLEAILRVTRIENEAMRGALHDHLVLREPCVTAAERYGYKRQQIETHAKQIEQKLVPAFDAYSLAAHSRDHEG